MNPSFWIVTISADNLELTKQHKLIGLPARRGQYSSRLAENDIIIFYVGKRRAGYGGYNASVSEFGPIARVTSSVYYDDSQIWNSRNDERYPWRWRISVTLDKRTSAHTIIKNLGFAHDKPKWGLYFVAGVRQVSETDFRILENALKALAD